MKPGRGAVQSCHETRPAARDGARPVRSTRGPVASLAELGDDLLGVGLHFFLAALAAEIERLALGADLERDSHGAEVLAADRAEGLCQRRGLLIGGELPDL